MPDQESRNAQYLQARERLAEMAGIYPQSNPFSYLALNLQNGFSISPDSMELSVQPRRVDLLIIKLAEIWGILRSYANTEFGLLNEEIDDSLYRMFSTKNAEYGDSFAKQGAIGCFVRLSDKLQRCATIINLDEIKHESLKDSVLDGINYCILTTLLLLEANG